MTAGRDGTRTETGEMTNGFCESAAETGAGIGGAFFFSSSELTETRFRINGVVLFEERLNAGNFGISRFSADEGRGS